VGQLPELTEVGPGALGILCEGWHGHEAAYVRTRLPRLRQKGREIRARDAGLRVLARQVDLDQGWNLEPARGRERVERVKKRASSRHLPGLPRLELTDEVPLEPVIPSLLLRDQILEAVLPHHLDSRLGELR
jgi:hypothetical protein